MRELGQRHQHHIRGAGVLHGKYKRTPRAILYNKRIHQNEPLTVLHEEKQELRSEPGTQAVVTMIAERLLPEPDLSGRLIPDVNRIAEGGALGGPSAYGFNSMTKFTSGTQTTPVTQSLNHRRDWTMGTNGSWRDGYAFANGQLLGATLMSSGYQSPWVASSSSTGGNPERWFEAAASYRDPTGATTDFVAGQNPDALAVSTTVPLVLQLRNYYHLYEELSWKIQNNSVTGTNVTIYECILNRDIPMRDTLVNGSAPTAFVNWGGMPCPLELWRQSQQFKYMTTGALDADGSLYMTGAPPAPLDSTASEGAGMTSSALQRDPVYSGVAAGANAKDIDYPNVTPHKAALLHTYYTVVPHSRYLPPGADTTITIGVRYNKRIPGAWWNTMYGVAGHSRCFFMVSRPDEVVGIAGADGSTTTTIDMKTRMPVMNATDLMVSWTKKKTVARVKQRARHTYVFKAAIPNTLDVAIRNPITMTVHDADVPMGALADEAVEGEMG